MLTITLTQPLADESPLERSYLHRFFTADLTLLTPIQVA